MRKISFCLVCLVHLALPDITVASNDGRDAGNSQVKRSIGAASSEQPGFFDKVFGAASSGAVGERGNSLTKDSQKKSNPAQQHPAKAVTKKPSDNIVAQAAEQKQEPQQPQPQPSVQAGAGQDDSRKSTEQSSVAEQPQTQQANAGDKLSQPQPLPEFQPQAQVEPLQQPLPQSHEVPSLQPQTVIKTAKRSTKKGSHQVEESRIEREKLAKELEEVRKLKEELLTLKVQSELKLSEDKKKQESDAANEQDDESYDDSFEEGVSPETHKLSVAPTTTSSATAPSTSVSSSSSSSSGKGDENLTRFQEMVSVGASSTSNIGWFSMGVNMAQNYFTRVYKSEAYRYSTGSYPSLTYGIILDTIKNKWFKGKSEEDLSKLTLKDFHYKLDPIHFSSAGHPGGYYVAVIVDCGRFSISLNNNRVNDTLSITNNVSIIDRSKAIYNAYLNTLKTSEKKVDMAAFNPTYDNHNDSIQPYQYLKYIRSYAESNNDNEPFYRDIQFCRRPNHSLHTYSMIPLRLLAFDTQNGYPIHWTLYGYRVVHSIGSGVETTRFLEDMKKFENADWLVRKNQ